MIFELKVIATVFSLIGLYRQISPQHHLWGCCKEVEIRVNRPPGCKRQGHYREKVVTGSNFFSDLVSYFFVVM